MQLYDQKLVTVNDLVLRNFKLIMTNGVFDCGLTAAHVCYLEKARLLGDKLLVALNSDASVRRLKGPTRPIVPLLERMQIIAALQCVDYIISFDEDTPINLIKEIKPEKLVKGGDYKPENVAGYGIVDVVILEKFETMSTTEKLEKIKASNL